MHVGIQGLHLCKEEGSRDGAQNESNVWPLRGSRAEATTKSYPQEPGGSTTHVMLAKLGFSKQFINAVQEFTEAFVQPLEPKLQCLIGVPPCDIG